MATRNWRTMVEEAEGRDFTEVAYTVPAYSFGSSKDNERVFKTRELPGQAYPWVDA